MKIAVLGCGKMGGALIKGVVAAGVIKAGDVYLSDAIPAAREALALDLPGSHVCKNNASAIGHADVILLCVKPADVESALREVASLGGSRLIISIAAGIPLAKLEAAAGEEARTIRVMPNTPALIGKGATAYALGGRATEEDAALAEKMFSAVGICTRVPEKLLDAVTGLSGSGPAYIYTVIEALADGGVLMGLGRAQALQLAAQTVAGAAEMVLSTGLHPAELRDHVTSPGGTTIAGLAKLESAGLRSALIEAVRAATERARELGKL